MHALLRCPDKIRRKKSVLAVSCSRSQWFAFPGVLTPPLSHFFSSSPPTLLFVSKPPRKNTTAGNGIRTCFEICLYSTRNQWPHRHYLALHARVLFPCPSLHRSLRSCIFVSEMSVSCSFSFPPRTHVDAGLMLWAVHLACTITASSQKGSCMSCVLSSS